MFPISAVRVRGSGGSHPLVTRWPQLFVSLLDALESVPQANAAAERDRRMHDGERSMRSGPSGVAAGGATSRGVILSRPYEAGWTTTAWRGSGRGRPTLAR